MLREAYPHPSLPPATRGARRTPFLLTTALRGVLQWSEVGAMALISLHREATPRVG